ncbi:acetyl-CoA carboxylase carboxyl transferase subunit alpha [Pseudoalteromonas luteoviolacea]|uniref:Acetyl-coenzyme A carboxylase carboxyl transferase subunit alpha n=1 Tax=Pseudoalteromonas luteoviolacea S4054 TaxID=1129367 RepID=A0A0F6AEN5_9GAMM|nr:acetyl-CoA carboxylase carboxyl transferase subunit alpha [Pseudoalteromonas luteoviolacea]AOT07549.1 acetyl-CoA carboxylase carboxyltransferase subunit alpha [Pseudoalteromonas luteoviolacea]AOT12465.1 acetyl-CoA carboxylase carboxyltransferase subunit alpha [Pseudoalteromonas luteoviolacea]AOT17379.1 acetyl-CoA carboxylase carboxyltransferase subunit alpha [Pseudoalteromonas luteoviolacea]KKE84638.1 acetyl-CoA carboxylase subunit alpha [Pseudoalteromonas luteoviolacea S4054]KZN74262.1 ace
MSLNYLEFELPVAELEQKIKELQAVSRSGSLDLSLEEEISKLKEKSVQLTEKIYSELNPWQLLQLARHPMRPHASDFIKRMFTEFDEFAGDRAFANDPAIIGGTARLDGKPVMVIGQEKGRDTAEKIKRNFGMPRPEGYRKAKRLMEMAERFKMPVITLIDTQGAYPGIGAEERGQSEAIAMNLKVMASLKVPTICSVIGEGGSGGALAIGVGDRVNMLRYSTYSVITPEGCASILWKSAEKAPLAAEAMGVSAQRIKDNNLINEIVAEPLGGAHRDYDTAARNLKAQIIKDLDDVSKLSQEEMLEQRYQRLMSFGYCS